jgi:hypothetical protein
MQLRAATAAYALMLVISVVASAFAAETAAEEEPACTGRAPFREVAQDEIYTFAERCRMREEFLRADRERALPNGVGWAKAPIRKTGDRDRPKD